MNDELLLLLLKVKTKKIGFMITIFSLFATVATSIVEPSMEWNMRSVHAGESGAQWPARWLAAHGSRALVHGRGWQYAGLQVAC